jgi:hypothetical protein
MSDDAADVLAKAVTVVELALRRWPAQHKRMMRWRAAVEAEFSILLMRPSEFIQRYSDTVDPRGPKADARLWRADWLHGPIIHI